MNTESEQKYLKKTNEYVQMNELKDIVDAIFNVDISNPIRKEEYVEARMVFAKILRDKGVTLASIGNYLGKNHCSILNYMSNFDNYFSDKALKNKYVICRDSFFEKHPVDRLYFEKDRIYAIENKYKRFKNILDIMNDKTPYGKEEVLEKKIISFLNGI